MIDIHAHFAEEGYDFPAEWEKIRAAGVDTVILAADTLEHAAWHAEFAETHAGAFFTVGIHPEFAASCPPPASKVGVATSCPPPASGGGVGEGVRPGSFTQTTAETFRALASRKNCAAVGEIGLDYHYGTETREAQLALFEAQLALAEELALPVQIHSRDACADTLAVLRARTPSRGFLMHCYSYGAENLNAFLDLGAHVSFGGVVCFKNARRAVEAAAMCPMDRILTETDSPYLSPFRGEKNTPANIPVILKKLAEIKGVSSEEMEGRVRENAEKLFPKLA